MFNRKLTDLLEDLAACFPSVPEFAVAVSPPARMLLNIDPLHGQMMFHKFIALPYESFILAKDETFIMKQTQFGPMATDAVNNIKRAWMQAPLLDQEAVWKHLHVLIILNRRCIAAASTASHAPAEPCQTV